TSSLESDQSDFRQLSLSPHVDNGDNDLERETEFITFPRRSAMTSDWLPADTTPEARQVELEVWRRMPPEKRLALAFRMTASLRETQSGRKNDAADTLVCRAGRVTKALDSPRSHASRRQVRP